jgi:hypothetical protein
MPDAGKTIRSISRRAPRAPNSPTCARSRSPNGHISIWIGGAQRGGAFGPRIHSVDADKLFCSDASPDACFRSRRPARVPLPGRARRRRGEFELGKPQIGQFDEDLIAAFAEEVRLHTQIDFEIHIEGPTSGTRTHRCLDTRQPRIDPRITGRDRTRGFELGSRFFDPTHSTIEIPRLLHSIPGTIEVIDSHTEPSPGSHERLEFGDIEIGREQVSRCPQISTHLRSPTPPDRYGHSSAIRKCTPSSCRSRSPIRETSFRRAPQKSSIYPQSVT